MLHPDIQTKLRAEIASFDADLDPTYQDLRYSDKFPLLDAVCKEMCVMYTSLPLNHTLTQAQPQDVSRIVA